MELIVQIISNLATIFVMTFKSLLRLTFVSFIAHLNNNSLIHLAAESSFLVNNSSIADLFEVWS